MRFNSTKLIGTVGFLTLAAATILMAPSAYGQAAAQAQRQEGATTNVAAKLIPRTVLFGNPEKAPETSSND